MKGIIFLLLSSLFYGEAVVAAPVKPKSSLAYLYYSKGVELVAKKKFEDALEKFQAAIDLNPAYVTSYIEYARTAVMLGKRTAGLEKLAAAKIVAKGRDDRDRVLRERESLSDIFYTNETFQQYQNGLNYLRLDRVSSALDAFERALKTEPDNLLILVAYARALRLEDRAKDALVVLERAFALNDSKSDVRVGLAEAIQGDNPSRALELLELVQDSEPDEHIIWVQAQALISLKRGKEAIEVVRVFYEKQPNSQYAPLWLGKLYAQEPNGAWNARKFLMTFLRRTESQSLLWKDEIGPEARQMRAARLEADQILARVNRSLD